jgi:serine/threonine protein kinase
VPVETEITGSAQFQQRYQILDRIDAGGMAEVFKAKSISMQGFERLVAIKRIHPNLVENDKFLNMFLDEAKLSLSLNHANIVQVFDIGRSAETYFIVMEYVDGINLKALIDTLLQRDLRIPVAQAAYILNEVCKGLAHAHQKRDLDGNHLGIVHRDVSPPNVLVSTEGEVKLTDFGLAKGVFQAELTDPGVVKGKFGYLSPEAAHAHEVDIQTDVFACGIVLWEVLTGRRLFQGKSDLKTLELVRKADVVPPSTYNPDVPADLDHIVLKALAREKKDRYLSAQALGSDLHGFLFKHALQVSAYDIATLVRQALRFSMLQAGRAGSREINSLVQQEIDRIIRIEQEALVLEAADRESTISGDATASVLADPRVWGDFADLGLDDSSVLRAKPGLGEEERPMPGGHGEEDPFASPPTGSAPVATPREPSASKASLSLDGALRPATTDIDIFAEIDRAPGGRSPTRERAVSAPPEPAEPDAATGSAARIAAHAVSAGDSVAPLARRLVLVGLGAIMVLGLALFALLVFL